MTAIPPPPDAGANRKAAGIGAVALGTLVAVGVAALFLVLIGTSRSGRPVPAHRVEDAPIRDIVVGHRQREQDHVAARSVQGGERVDVVPVGGRRGPAGADLADKASSKEASRSARRHRA
jgi:hypothetical protein